MCDIEVLNVAIISNRGRKEERLNESVVHGGVLSVAMKLCRATTALY